LVSASDSSVSAVAAKRARPSTTAHYLGSGLIKGIEPRLADKIVDPG
jgi:hypothetical protein